MRKDGGLDHADEEVPMRRAATYSRMSTEHQNYSLEHRRIKFQAFAAANALTITRQYVDHGKSGLDLKGRAGLQSLLADVTNQPDIDVILVYDVSRWGRFQDVDESAYYEYVCRRAGIPVLYCAEQFANDNTAISSILKALKRLMASESRCWRRWRGANSPRVRLHSAPSTGEHTLDHACRNRTLPKIPLRLTKARHGLQRERMLHNGSHPGIASLFAPGRIALLHGLLHHFQIQCHVPD